MLNIEELKSNEDSDIDLFITKDNLDAMIKLRSFL
jgi:hypothetical protein